MVLGLNKVYKLLILDNVVIFLCKKCFGGINNVFVVFDIFDNIDEDNWFVILFFNNL